MSLMPKSSEGAVSAPQALAVMERTVRELAIREMRTMRIKAGQHVFSPGDSCTNYLIVRSGEVRVSVMTETGREITLYRIEPGETCVLTVACLMSGTEYDAEAIAETDVEAYVIPRPVFNDMLASSSDFRRFIFTSYGERLRDLISLVQEIAVKHVDRRLARLLLARAEGQVVELSHQALAMELGTAREVVTRLLNDFSDRGWVKLQRGRVIVVDDVALQQVARTM